MKTFVVLGMHRSATSLVSKGLSNEINMGASFQPMEDNPKGHLENWNIVAVNDEILSLAGGSWDNPPSHKSIMKVKGSKVELDINYICNKFNMSGDNWGFKDPRTCLTIDLWLPYLINPHFVCVYRDPMQVAESLKARNGFTIEKGLRLAKEYNKRIAQFLKRRGLA